MLVSSYVSSKEALMLITVVITTVNLPGTWYDCQAYKFDIFHITFKLACTHESVTKMVVSF